MPSPCRRSLPRVWTLLWATVVVVCLAAPGTAAGSYSDAVSGTSGLLSYLGPEEALKPGDLIILNGHGTELDHVTHALVVTRGGSRPWIAQHSGARHWPFANTRARLNDQVGSGNWAYWKVRPIHTAANIG